MNENALTMTVSEIMKDTRMGREFIMGLIRTGKLPNIGNKKRFIVPRAAVIRYVETAGEK